MTVEHRLAEAVRRKTQAVPVPSIDVVALRQDARRQARLRIAVATAAAVIVGTLGGVALWQRTGSPADSPSGPAGRLQPQDGVRAFLDRNAGVLHLGGRSLALTEVPGLADSGLAVRAGVVYQTPDQEVRLISASGRQTVLAGALGAPPTGFTPSVAYDAGTDVVVALRLEAGSTTNARPLIEAYALSSGDRLARARMIRLADATAVTLAGATDGVAAVNFRGANWTGVLDWTWTTRHEGSEWRRGQVFDLRNRVVLVDWGADGPAFDPRFDDGGWRYVEGRAGERLDPTGAWRVDSTWQPWPSGGPVQRSTSGNDSAALPELPHGSSLSLAYDTDGSVLAAVADVAGSEDSVLVFDCELHAQACEPIGRIKSSTQDPLFLDGARP